MSDPQLIEKLVSHVFDSGVSASLMDRGRFPANWTSKYLSLLKRATNVWRDQSSWPREVVGAVHFASFYLPVRYESWRGLGGAHDLDTEKMLRQIRVHSEAFLLAGVVGR